MCDREEGLAFFQCNICKRPVCALLGGQIGVNGSVSHCEFAV